MNEEITELFRHVVQMIEDREGFIGNDESLLELDFQSLSDQIDDLYSTIDRLEEKVDILEDRIKEQVAEMQELIDDAEGLHLENCRLREGRYEEA